MSERDKQAAKRFVGRAGTQAKQAAKNSGRAARVAAKMAAEEAGDVVEEINDTAEDAVEAVGEAVKPAVKPGLQLIFSPMGKTVIGFSLAIGAAIYATHQSTKMYNEALKADPRLRRVK